MYFRLSVARRFDFHAAPCACYQAGVLSLDNQMKMILHQTESVNLPISLEICILAGGLSRRMGRDKAQLRLGNRTMLGQIQATARTTGWPVRVIRRDLVPGCGPVGGIHAALETTRRDAVLFLACDMPCVGLELLGCLVDRFRAAPGSLFISYRGRVGFPFLLPRRTLAAVARQLHGGEFSIQALAKVLEARTLQLPGRLARQLRNVNTRADWKRVRRAWSGQKKKP